MYWTGSRGILPMNRSNLVGLGLSLGLVGIWELGVRILDVPIFILPRPSDIALVAVSKAPLI